MNDINRSRLTQSLGTITETKKINQRNITLINFLTYELEIKILSRVFPNHPVSRVSNQQIIGKKYKDDNLENDSQYIPGKQNLMLKLPTTCC